MPYTITNEIRRRAEKLGVSVKSSSNPKKKLDVYKDGVKQASIGATGYPDYHIYKAKKGETVANQKRKQYKQRHEKDRKVKYRDRKLTAGYLADRLLW